MLMHGACCVLHWRLGFKGFCSWGLVKGRWHPPLSPARSGTRTCSGLEQLRPVRTHADPGTAAPGACAVLRKPVAGTLQGGTHLAQASSTQTPLQQPCGNLAFFPVGDGRAAAGLQHGRIVACWSHDA